MSQDVLVIPSEKLEDLYSSRRFYFSTNHLNRIRKILKTHAVFIDRSAAELSEDFKQVIAVGVIRCGTKILCLRRTKKSNRQALRLRWTVMIGGHVDNGDKQSNDPTLSCLLRELDEEIGVTPNKTPQLIGLAVDPENPVGRLHIGFVFDVQLETPQVRILSKFDNLEFVNSRNSRDYQFMNEGEVRSLKDKLDPWSYLYISSKFPSIHHNWSQNTLDEKELPLVWR